MRAYCALVELHAREGFVLHHVDVERVPNNVGIVRAGLRLTVSTA